MESRWDLWMLHSNNVLQCILVYSVIRGDAHKAESSKSHNRAPISSVHCARLLQFNTKFVMWRYPVKCKADETGSKCNVSVHCQEEGCTRKFIPPGPRDFPGTEILHPSDREIDLEGRGVQNPRPQGPRGMYFPMHPSPLTVYGHALSISREVIFFWHFACL